MMSDNLLLLIEQAGSVVRESEKMLADARATRDGLIQAGRRQRISLGQLARAAGLTKGAIQKIEKQGSR